MPELVGVRFKRPGRIYYFDPSGLELDINDYVVVETNRGQEIGWVVIAPKQVMASEISEPLKPVVRRAEPEDLKQWEELKAKEEEALAKCRERIAHYGLPMKLRSAEYNLDGSRITFYFSAEGMVDFRDLVRDLASIFKSRVELRQIGPRDEAKLIGGFGRCGRTLCCASHLCTFNTVSIRMAKEQDLPLNPMKISGVCGRLLCCLGYESEQYRLLREKLPPLGQTVKTQAGPALVVGGNPLKETVLVQLESQMITELPLTEVTSQEVKTPKPTPKRRNRNNKRMSSP